MLFDTHVHLNAEQYKEDLEEVIARAQEARSIQYGCVDLTVQRLKKRWNWQRDMSLFMHVLAGILLMRLI